MASFQFNENSHEFPSLLSQLVGLVNDASLNAILVDRPPLFALLYDLLDLSGR